MSSSNMGVCIWNCFANDGRMSGIQWSRCWYVARRPLRLCRTCSGPPSRMLGVEWRKSPLDSTRWCDQDGSALQSNLLWNLSIADWPKTSLKTRQLTCAELAGTFGSEGRRILSQAYNPCVSSLITQIFKFGEVPNEQHLHMHLFLRATMWPFKQKFMFGEAPNEQNFVHVLILCEGCGLPCLF